MSAGSDALANAAKLGLLARVKDLVSASFPVDTADGVR